MNILLVVATNIEVESIMASMVSKDHGFLLNEHDVHVLVTGVGMVATTYHLTSIFSSNTNYDLMLNIGLAGSLDRSLDLGTVVQVTADQIVELGAEDDQQFISALDMGLISEEEAILHNVSGIGNEVIDGLVQVDGMTVNTVHGNEESIARLVKRCIAQVETMEGAGFFYTCNQEDQPCAQIRAVSNYVEKRDKSKWKIDLALNNLSTVTLDILKAL